MIEKNEVVRIRKSLGASIIKMYFDDTLYSEIDKLPIKRTPKNKVSRRCCVYKDRAMSRYRMMSLMGIDIEVEDDEFKSLADFAHIAIEREKPNNDKIISIVDMSCAACQQHTYIVTDICMGCEARPCETNCPKDAVKIINGKSIINYDLCVSCGKCFQVCPFNAIAYSPVPCEKDCPVDAISRDSETGKEVIDYDKCIFCGRCIQACPFGTVVERSQILYVAKKLKNKVKPIVAMLAPSVIAQFPGTVGQLMTALKKIGFDFVYEVAYGADVTAAKEAEELIEKVGSKEQAILGTSCCPAYVESVKKHILEFKDYVSSTKTPMSYTADMVKDKHPDCISVFIGPCIAKKFEGINDPNVNYVLTFEELSSFLLAFQIEVNDLEDSDYDSADSTNVAKRFCISSGVTETVKYYANKIDPSFEIKPLFINGLDRKGLNMLRQASKGKLPYNLVECMSCEGGCIAGPGVNVSPKVSLRKLDKLTK